MRLPKGGVGLHGIGGNGHPVTGQVTSLAKTVSQGCEGLHLGCPGEHTLRQSPTLAQRDNLVTRRRVLGIPHDRRDIGIGSLDPMTLSLQGVPQMQIGIGVIGVLNDGRPVGRFSVCKAIDLAEGMTELDLDRRVFGLDGQYLLVLPNGFVPVGCIPGDIPRQARDVGGL